MSKLEIKFLDDAFHYRGQSYPYSNVVNVEWFATRTKFSYNFVPIGSYDSARLKIYLKSQPKPLEIKVGFMFSNSTVKTESLFEIYRSISERTFEYRALGYLDQLQTSGFFVYSGYHFFTNGNIANDKNGKVLYNIHRDHLLATDNSFELSIRRDSQGVLDDLKSRLGTHFISLWVDRDVFYYLIYTVYGLSFRTVERDPLLKQVYDSIKSQVVGRHNKCPYCAERIKAEAIKCKHCGSMLTELSDNGIQW